MRRLILLLLLCAFIVPTVGCMGRVVPPGKKVIILHPSGESTIKSEGVYKAWGRDKLYFVDQKLKSYTEHMQILCADDINMDVEVKAIVSFEVDDASVEFIKEKVPAVRTDGTGDIDGCELSLDQFYATGGLQDVLRASARMVINKHETDDIRPQREQIESELSALFRKRVEELNYPITISAVLLSNIDYPPTVIEQRNAIKRAQLEDQRKAAEAEATLAEAQRQAGIEVELAKVRMVKAQAQADEQQILSESLTPEYLKLRQLEVLENVSTAMAKGNNNVVFIMPYEAISTDTLNTAMLRESVGELKEAAHTGAAGVTNRIVE
jgi:regulator of protease activity HflC (stomatin/prohibitin superfamily)